MRWFQDQMFLTFTFWLFCFCPVSSPLYSEPTLLRGSLLSENFFFFCFFLLLPSPFSLPFVLNFQIVPLPLFFSPFPSPLSPSTQPKTAHLWFLFSSLCATQSETLPLSAGQRARIPIRAIDQSPLTPHYPDSVFLSAVHIHTHTHTAFSLSNTPPHEFMQQDSRTHTSAFTGLHKLCCGTYRNTHPCTYTSCAATHTLLLQLRAPSNQFAL